MDDAPLNLDEIWNILTMGDDVERRPVALTLRSLDGPSKHYLTQRVLEKLETDCRPDAPGGDHNPELRGWLLSTLIRLATPDNPLHEKARERAAQAVERAAEPVSWARYWVLETFYQCDDPEIEELAIRALADPARPTDDKNTDFVVAMATVLLALRRPDSEYAETVKRSLEPPLIIPQYTRPFRTIFSPVFVNDLIAVIEEQSYCDAMFDAIGQIGMIPQSHPARERAAAALASLIKSRRRHSFWDQARTLAINALARVGSEESVITIAPDLCDDNPAVVRAAACAISDIRGCAAVGFIAEQARRVAAARPVRRETIIRQYAHALRCLHEHRGDDTVISELSELLGSGREDDRTIANELMINLGGSKAYEKLRDKERFIDSLVRADQHVKKQIEEVVHSAQEGLVLSRQLDIGIFVLGIALVIAITVTAMIYANGNFAILAGALGSGGVVGVLLSTWLVASRARILEATQWLVHVHAVFMGYTRQLHQTDQAFARRLGSSERVGAEELKLFARLVDDAMKGMLPRLARPPRRSWFRNEPAATGADQSAATAGAGGAGADGPGVGGAGPPSARTAAASAASRDGQDPSRPAPPGDAVGALEPRTVDMKPVPGNGAAARNR